MHRAISKGGRLTVSGEVHKCTHLGGDHPIFLVEKNVARDLLVAMAAGSPKVLLQT
jgi:hypothetical protein